MIHILQSLILSTSLLAQTHIHHEEIRGLLQGPMEREASGTSWQPDSTPMGGIHGNWENWMWMVHGLNTSAVTLQSGSRGNNEFYDANMFMFSTWRHWDRITFGVKTMWSLDPLTLGQDGYPLLFQTGETADGVTPLIDRQHPHDFFSELAFTTGFRFTDDHSLFIYAGLPGEPALGPPMFLHRFSGMEFPEAPITHHWLDSTHISFGVVTMGYVWRSLKMEGSLFNGREPDQDRWNIETEKLDSYSGRMSLNVGNQWALQASYGHLKSPEQLDPTLDVDRVTFSASYQEFLGPDPWQTTLAWGLNIVNPGETLPGLLLETHLALHQKHHLLGRGEIVQKNELFQSSDPRSDHSFTIGKLSLGYLYDFAHIYSMRMGLGGMINFHFIPTSLESTYGTFPIGGVLFLRLDLL